MNKYLYVLSLLIFSYSAHANDFQIVNTKGSALLSVDSSTSEFVFKSTSSDPKDKSISYAWKAIKPKLPCNTISFEVKGDGTDFYASIFLGQHKYLLDGYETVFSLKNTEWETVEIPLSDFARNVKPWAVKKMDGNGIKLKSEIIKYIGFGRGYTIYKPNHPNYSFSIRNIKFTTKKYPTEIRINYGLKNTVKKIKNGENIKVLLLGDSITDMGRDQSHSVHAFKALQRKYGGSFEIVNAAIGGHSVRGGQIILPRSLAKMPKPDLAVIFFGANDCKSNTGSNGFSEQVFEKQVLGLIKMLNGKTNGHTEYLLINGVPRIDKANKISTGAVEQISGAYTNISKQHKLSLCDTMAVLNKLSVDKKRIYFKDTVHQTQEGLKFIGTLIKKAIIKEMK